MTISPKPGSTPLIGKDEWFKVFDSWDDARRFFQRAKWAHIDEGVTYPWDTRGEEYRLGKMTRDPETGVVKQHEANPSKRKPARRPNPKPARKMAAPAMPWRVVPANGTGAIGQTRTQAEAVKIAHLFANHYGKPYGVKKA